MPPAPPVRAAAPRQEAEDDSDVIKKFGLSISRRVGKTVNDKGHDRVYPRLARERKWEGVTQVAVEYNGGKPKSPRIAKSSGFPLLDQRAVELVQEVLPEMTPPTALRKRSQFTVTLPIVFKLQDKQ
jgi:TonB family protein